MATCPQCKTTHKRRANGGLCPSCGVEITIHEGEWFSTDGENPAMILLTDYEKFYSLWVTNGERKNEWKINKSHISRELKQSSRIIHEICGGDLELARASLALLFEDKRWSFRNYSTLLFTIRDLYATKVVAEQIMNTMRKKEDDASLSEERTSWRQEALSL